SPPITSLPFLRDVKQPGTCHTQFPQSGIATAYSATFKPEGKKIVGVRKFGRGSPSSPLRSGWLLRLPIRGRQDNPRRSDDVTRARGLSSPCVSAPARPAKT